MIPLVFKDAALGAAAVRFEAPHSFTSEEIEFFTAAGQRGQALERARLHDAGQEARAAEIEALYQSAPIGLAVFDTDLRFRLSSRRRKAGRGWARRGARHDSGRGRRGNGSRLHSRRSRKAGYRVLTANDGREALQILQARPGSIDLALVDLTMPGMSGDEVADEVAKLHSDVKIVVMSGYNETEARRMFAGKPVASFLQKPFLSSRLADRINQVLAG